MRIGVIGTGFGRRVVAAVFAETPGCEVVEVVSARDDAAVRALCRRRDVDLVSVHSPPFLHAPHVRTALAAGRHVHCDKPFALDAAEAEALLHEAESAGVRHLLNFEFRCDPARERVKELVAGGTIGAIEHVAWTAYHSGSRRPLRRHGWLFEKDKGGGWVGAWGSHAVDAIRWMFGEVRSVRSSVRTTIRERPDRAGVLHPCDAEDAFTAWLGLENGATVSIDSSFAAPADLPTRLTILGSEGAIELVADRRITVRRPDGSREEIDVPAEKGDPHLVPMRRWAVRMRDAVADGKPIAPSFADGLACDRVLEKLRGRDLTIRG